MPPIFLSVTITFSTRSVSLLRGVIRWTKFGSWECHMPKYAARIVTLSAYALLVGYAIFCCVNEILCRTYNSYYREDTKRNTQVSFSLLAVTKCS